MFSRRSILSYVAASYALSTTRALSKQCAITESDCPKPCRITQEDWFKERCDIKIPKRKFEFAPQEMSNWCWAACIQAAMLLKNYHVTQDKIVRKVFSDGRNEEATLLQLERLLAIRTHWVDANGKCFSVTSDAIFDAFLEPGRIYDLNKSDGSKTVYESLDLDWPVIISVSDNLLTSYVGGHAVLLLKASFNVKMKNGERQNLFFAFDPIQNNTWPNGIRTLTPQEVQTTRFALGIQVWQPLRRTGCYFAI